MFCANKPECGPQGSGEQEWEGWFGSERSRAGGGVQVLTSQVQVDNESPCLLSENDLREMKGSRAQQRAPFSAPLKRDHSQGLPYECTFYFAGFFFSKGPLKPKYKHVKVVGVDGAAAETEHVSRRTPRMQTKQAGARHKSRGWLARASQASADA